MAWSQSEYPERIGFLSLPRFSMMAFLSAVEPLRVANRLHGRELYSWHVFSADGQPVEASNGMTVAAEASLGDIKSFPTGSTRKVLTSLGGFLLLAALMPRASRIRRAHRSTHPPGAVASRHSLRD